MSGFLASLVFASALTSPISYPESSTPQLAGAAHTFSVQGDQFVLNGKPFVVKSGEIHYPRIPRELWRDRLKKARAMGLNTICTYVFWNLHEPQPGRFNFSGNLDLAAFVRTAGEEGLKVIVRPGPYVCTELDFGGFPAWLLKDRSMIVRSRDPKFLAATERYFREVGKQIRPLLPQHGGPIIMAQVENEYGSYAGDHEYMAWMRDAMRRTGFDLQLFTSDGPGQTLLERGTLPDLPPTINFGSGAEASFASLAKFRPNTPRMIGEYWCGWFDHWGKRHHTTSIATHVKDLEWCLQNGDSFNLYMFHGGTNFGFMQGSNGSATSYDVDTTSYDYDAPLDESGRVTPKYRAFRDLLARYSESPLPPLPNSPATIAIPRIRLEESAPLLSRLPSAVRSERPLTFEELNQAHGLVMYRTRVRTGGRRLLELGRLGDYATVFVGGRRVAELDRRRGQSSVEVEIPTAGAELDILVEALSRVNFGSLIPTERKGLDGEVRLGGTVLKNWAHYRFPMTDLRGLRWSSREGAGPRFYRGSLNVAAPGDTFLDLKGWNKGYVWVNGHNLGRFWKIGPQRTLFLPGVWLKPGANEIVVFDDGERIAEPTIEGLNAPILDEVSLDPNRLSRTETRKIAFTGLTPVASAALPNSREAQSLSFASPVRGRYIAVQILSGHSEQPFASLAEIGAFGADGVELDRKAWRIAYADSQEQDGENGQAGNVLDNQPTTIWHTEWSAGNAPMPHLLILDLGTETMLSGLRLLPRQESPNGRFKEIRVYVSPNPFPGM